MNFDTDKHQRRSIRLKDYDYSRPGYYYVTICIQNRECLLGNVSDSHVNLNAPGKMINMTWKEIPLNYNKFDIDEYIIMPNHIHGIIIIKNHNTIYQKREAIPAITVSDLIKRFKTLTMHRYINGVKNNSWKRFNERLWQRNFYEHIIRNDKELEEIRKYIAENPAKWAEDKYNPINIKKYE